MAKQLIVEGQTAKNPSTGERIIYRSGKWYPVDQDPMGGKTNADAPITPLTPGSDARTRLAAGLGPSIAAQEQMYQSEGWNRDPAKPGGTSPYDIVQHPRAFAGKMIDSIPDNGALAGVARAVGGDTLQNYEQAAKSFESAFLPILSGAAVTPTEAQRMIRANLPEVGDSPHILARKTVNRGMMINAAADLLGRPRPFPKIGIMPGLGIRPNPQPAPQAGTGGQPNARGSDAAGVTAGTSGSMSSADPLGIR